jgi:formylglycine-generating enzyme required for sulfatase activity
MVGAALLVLALAAVSCGMSDADLVQAVAGGKQAAGGPNDTWTPGEYTVSCSGGTCTVPAGPFMMGCNGALDQGWDCNDGDNVNEKPYHKVALSAFEIDRTEVTVAAYKACFDAGQCSLASTSMYCNWGVAGKEQHPINCVTWAQAKEYCEWAGKRLCTEAEWEKAGRGTDGRKYPWGNEMASCAYAVMDDGGIGCGTGATMAVGSKTAGASPYGTLDMAGNVWEWVSDWYDSEFYEVCATNCSDPQGPGGGSSHVFRGGSFYDPHYVLRVSSRYDFVPFGADYVVGARCCRSL